MSSPEFSTNKGKAIPLRVRVQQLLAETFFSDLNRRYSSQLGPAERAFVMDAMRLARSTSVPLLLRIALGKRSMDAETSLVQNASASSAKEMGSHAKPIGPHLREIGERSIFSWSCGRLWRFFRK